MFSIIMPTYNGAKYIQETIISILGQTHKEFELIIVDDGSTDNTYEICCKFAEIDGRIRLYRQNHLGVSAARNIGIENARYEFVLFIDADDIFDDSLLEKILTHLKDVDCLIYGICADYYLEDGKFLKCEKNNYNFLQSEARGDLNYEEMFRRYNMVSACNKVYRKSILDGFGIRFSTECVYVEDLKFNFDYLKNVENIFFLNEDLYHYRRIMGKKQILKRKFRDFYTNANEIYSSCNSFLETKKCQRCVDNPFFCGMLINIYLQETYCHLNAKEKGKRIEAVKCLNKNEGFRLLIKSMKGKFIILLRVAILFRMFTVEALLILKRYGNEG